MIGEQYASLYPKVKSWKQSLLTSGDLDNLNRMNLSELVLFIRSRIKKTTMNTESVSEIEGIIKQEGFYFIQSAVRFLSGSARDFLKVWSKIYEIENLKNLTRAVLSGKTAENLYELAQNSRIQKDLIKEIKSLDELQQFLSGTEYYRLAQDSFPRIKEDKSTFHFEINLDNFFAQTIRKKMASLPYEDRKEVKGVLAYYLEVNRFLWIYRAKFNYGLANEEVVSILPNVLSILPAAQYTKLVESDSSESFINTLKSAGILDKETILDENFNLEKEAYVALFKRARKHVSGNPFNLGVFLGFMILHYLNVRNLVILLESKKIQFETEKSAELLVMK